MDFEDYDLVVSKELVDYIMKSNPYLKTIKRSGRDYFIGYNHRLPKGEYPETINHVKALDLFYKDIKNIENYTLIKSIKNKIDFKLYEVLVHFCFDYGKHVLKNSKMYFYAKQNDHLKVIEELEKFKTFKNTRCKLNISKRDFDIYLINNGKYKTKEVKNGNKKRSSSKNVGFRF